ncbi:MAG TPA: YoaK family protein [Candidatus Dormibacteraeota bacterium]
MVKVRGGLLVRDVLLIALTAAAGWADTIAYLGLGRVFTANMTGNLVLLGLAVGQLQVSSAERAGAAFAGFVAGGLLGSRLTAKAASHPWHPRVNITLGAEAAVLIVFSALWWTGAERSQAGLDTLIGLSALGMGLQTAAVRRLALAGVSTTFVTGTLSNLVAGLAALRFTDEWTRQAAVLVALPAGAVVGAAIWSRWPAPAASGPAALVTAVTLAAALAMRPARSEPNG